MLSTPLFGFTSCGGNGQRNKVIVQLGSRGGIGG